MSVARRLLGLRILLGLGDTCEVLLVGGFAAQRDVQRDSDGWAVDICNSPRECAGKRYDLIYMTADDGMRPRGNPMRHLDEWLSRARSLLNDSGFCCVGFRNRWSLRNLLTMGRHYRCGAATDGVPASYPLSVTEVTAAVSRSGLEVYEILGAWPDHYALKFLAPRNGPSIDYLFTTLQAGGHRSRVSELLHKLAVKTGFSGALTESYVIVTGGGHP